MYKGSGLRSYGVQIQLRTRTGELVQRDVTVQARNRSEADGRARTVHVTPTSTILNVTVA